MSTMFADTILIVFISICTALLAEGEPNLSDRSRQAFYRVPKNTVIAIEFYITPDYMVGKRLQCY